MAQRYALADTPDARVVSAMELAFPAWQVWCVICAVSPKIWCARRWADVDAIPARVINAGSSIELAEKIQESITSGEER